MADLAINLLCNFIAKSAMLRIWIHLLSFLRLRGFAVCVLLASALLSGQYLFGETFSVTVSGTHGSPGNASGTNYSSYTVPFGSLYTFTLKSVSFSVSNSDGHSFYLRGSYDAEWNNGYESGEISKPGNAGINFDPCSFQVRTWDYSTRIDFGLMMQLGWNDIGPTYFTYEFVVTWEIDDGSGSGGDDDDDNPPAGDDDDDNPPAGDDDDDNPPAGDDDDDNPPAGDDDDDNPPAGDDDDDDPSGGGGGGPTGNVGLSDIYRIIAKNVFDDPNISTVIDGEIAIHDTQLNTHHLLVDNMWYLRGLHNYLTDDSFSGTIQLDTSASDVLGSISSNDLSSYTLILSTKIGSNPYSKLGYNNLLASYRDNDSFASEVILTIPENLGGQLGNGFGFPSPTPPGYDPSDWSSYAYHYAPLSKALFRFVLYLSLFIYIIRKFGWD